MGEAGLPQSVLVEKQRVVIDELKGKLNLKVDDMDRLTFDDLRWQVDSAIDQVRKKYLIPKWDLPQVGISYFIRFSIQNQDRIVNSVSLYRASMGSSNGNLI